MTVDTAPLGLTGLHVTRVGLGAWAIGGPGWKFAWGDQDDDRSVDAIRTAIDLGLNWIDTAACYGRGHSEEVIASALRDLPPADRPLIFTKCGVLAPEGQADPALVGHPDSIRREVDDSLRRLRVEVIDLYQMHWPAQDGTPLETYWQTLADLRTEGKVRFIGLSNHDLEQTKAAHALARVDTIQPPFSALDRRAAEDLLPWAHREGVGVIVYSPMQSGLLTGSITSERVAQLPPDDWRRTHPDFNGDGLSRRLQVTDALGEVARANGRLSSEAAIAWVLGWPGVSGAIVGARSAEQVNAWFDAGDWRLSDDDYAAVGAAIVRADVGEGPVAPPRQREGRA